MASSAVVVVNAGLGFSATKLTNDTLTLTATTPGDISVSYAVRTCEVERIGSMVIINYNITATPTFTTASGAIVLTGLSYPSDGLQSFNGTLSWSGVTKAGYTHINSRLGAVSASTIDFVASGSGLGLAQVQTTDIVSGAQMILRGQIIYNTAA